jgi:lysozyme family protein
MADFDPALQRTLVHEGGYARDPRDRGGETYKGVARTRHPGWEGWARIDRARRARGFPGNLADDAVLQAAVTAFYRRHFWEPLRGDVLPDQSVAEELFDSGVNMGLTRAVEFLQRALNVLNRDGTLYADLVVDGDLGPKTLAALRAYLKKDKAELLVTILNVLQGMRYIELMTQSPIQEAFARGWFKRVVLDVA